MKKQKNDNKDGQRGNVKLYEHYFKADWRNGEAFI